MLTRTLLAITLVATIPASAEESRFAQLPEIVRSEVEDVRGICSNMFKATGRPSEIENEMAGIVIGPLLEHGRNAVMVDFREVCGPGVVSGGVNCSNRGCDLKIWQERPNGHWILVFDEHARSALVLWESLDVATLKIKRITVSVASDDPRCRSTRGRHAPDRSSCDLDARWKNGRWAFKPIL